MPSLIGNKPNQVPTNGDLGKLAFMDVLDSFTSKTLMDTDTTNIAPSLNLDFANSKVLDPRITFTRSTTATFYDGKSSSKAEENLLVQSQDFDNAAWVKGGVTVSANATIAPDGTTTADSVTATAVTGYKNTSQNPLVASGSVHTVSFYVKANGYTKAYITNSNTSNFSVAFDLTAVSVISTAGAGYVSSSIVDVGNGWRRCVVSVTAIANNSVSIVGYPDSGATLNAFGAQYTGDGVNGIYVWGAQAEVRSAVSAYTPTTTQAITNYIPALQTAASGVARFDHNPTTGESLGLLIEESRTNLVTYSDDFSNAAWTKTATTVESNTAISPDGTLTADKEIATSTSGVHTARQTFTATAAAHTFSVYAKAGGNNWLAISMDATVFVYYDLINGVLGNIGAGHTATITSVGNGWYRCTATFTYTAGTKSVYANIASANGVTSFAGDEYSGLYIWGAQLEAGSFATSYIPTAASQVTRAADAASMTGTNFSSWYRADEGTMIADVVCTPSLNNRVVLDFNAGSTSSNYIALFAQRSSSAGILAFVNANATSQVDASTQTNADGKTAFAYKVNDFGMTRNGAGVFTDSIGVVPQGIDRVFIGDDYNAGNAINGTIKKIQYFPKRLSNAELQEITG